MRRDRISRLADLRRLYTNETYDQARSQVRAGRPPIPAAAGEQPCFEADLVHELVNSCSDFTAYSFGIRRVRSGSDSIELEVESERRAHEILRRILPSYEPGGEVQGMPGLRIWQRRKNGIEIHQSGRATSARLTGLPAGAWKRVEAEALDIILAELAWRPLWKGADRWSAEGLRAAMEHGRVVARHWGGRSGLVPEFRAVAPVNRSRVSRVWISCVWRTPGAEPDPQRPVGSRLRLCCSACPADRFSPRGRGGGHADTYGQQ